MRERNFNKELFYFLDKIKNNENFAFSKYADGEYAILRNEFITNCDNWTFDPHKHNKHHLELLSSFKFSDPEYYVGISCPCCVPHEHVKWMRDNVNVDDNHLTWANLFVNSNYDNYKKYFIEEYKNHDIILIANKKAKIENLPFKIEKHIKISNTAFIDDFNLVNTLQYEKYINKLFLFAAGPLGNMLVAKMWKYNKNNIYLDIGSTLNPWLVGNNRGYLKNFVSKNKICIW